MDDSLESGLYRMIFQGLGEEETIFSETEKPIFYLAGADYSIGEISAYLPGYSSDSYLIAPGTVVMVEAGVTAGEGLDPYVVWYDGKKRIGESAFPAGRSSLFFKVPEENGFRLLRAEAYPFPPDETKDPGNSGVRETARGKIRELSLPVSYKGTGPDYFWFSEEARENFAAYYLFAGDLKDSLDPRPERVLIQEHRERGASWLGYGGIFGLAVGQGDCYLIPREILEGAEQDGGKKTFTFRAKPLGDGPVFSVLFANGLGEIQVSLKKEHLVLTLTTEGGSEEVETALPPAEDFTVFSISLDFRENALTVSLSPEGMSGTEASLDFAGVSAGAAVYRLGSPVSGTDSVPAGEEEPGEEARDLPPLPALILDELAVTARKE
jgi:hypothetical protein